MIELATAEPAAEPVEPIAELAELTAGEWRAREQAHQERIDAAIAGHRDRAGRGKPHPVEDFLFTYYSHRPAQLRRWHPGAGVALLGSAALTRETWRGYRVLDDRDGVTVDVAEFFARRRPALDHVLALLRATAGRPGQFGCFGLHEWAMVYRQADGDVRHGAHPLRLGAAGTDAVVQEAAQSRRIRCTHHDAFRFFTDRARPLNELQPARTDQVALEQPGCLHATMDLYKWAYKLMPALPSELLADLFDLARRTRELDMRASPYDLSALGYQPVPIETAAGRAEYAAQQKTITAAGHDSRARLLAACEAVLALAGERSERA